MDHILVDCSVVNIIIHITSLISASHNNDKCIMLKCFISFV